MRHLDDLENAENWKGDQEKKKRPLKSSDASRPQTAEDKTGAPVWGESEAGSDPIKRPAKRSGTPKVRASENPLANPNEPFVMPTRSIPSKSAFFQMTSQIKHRKKSSVILRGLSVLLALIISAGIIYLAINFFKEKEDLPSSQSASGNKLLNDSIDHELEGMSLEELAALERELSSGIADNKELRPAKTITIKPENKSLSSPEESATPGGAKTKEAVRVESAPQEAPETAQTVIEQEKNVTEAFNVKPDAHDKVTPPREVPNAVDSVSETEQKPEMEIQADPSEVSTEPANTLLSVEDSVPDNEVLENHSSLHNSVNDPNQISVREQAVKEGPGAPEAEMQAHAEVERISKQQELSETLPSVPYPALILKEPTIRAPDRESISSSSDINEEAGALNIPAAERSEESTAPSFLTSAQSALSGSLKEMFISYEEEFDGNSKEWPEFENSSTTAYVKGGKYQIENKTSDSSHTIFHPQDLPHSMDFMIQASFASLTNTGGHSYGYVFGARDNLAKFTFEVRDNSFYAIKKYQGGISEDLASGQIDNVFIGNNNLKVLKIVKQGERIRFYINDHYMEEISGLALWGNKTGFIIEGKMYLTVDWLKTQLRFNNN